VHLAVTVLHSGEYNKICELGFLLLACLLRKVLHFAKPMVQPYLLILSTASKLSSDRPSQYVRQADDSSVLQKVLVFAKNTPDNSGSLIDLLTLERPDRSSIILSKHPECVQTLTICETQQYFTIPWLLIRGYFSLHI
jgi:hypothetical protein